MKYALIGCGRIAPNHIKAALAAADRGLKIAAICDIVPEKAEALAERFELGDVPRYTDYKKMLADRYASFDSGKGKEFEEGKMSLEQLVDYAKANGEPKQVSGKQELYERIVSMYC